MQKKRVVILGSTGSIGRSAIDIISKYKDRFDVVAIAAKKNVSLLSEQVRILHPKFVYIYDPEAADRLKADFPGIYVFYGSNGILELLGEVDADLVLNAIIGFDGFLPTIKSIERGFDIALANKESLVVGGDFVLELLNDSSSRLIPVDSEHSAIFSLLSGRNSDDISSIYLTASGGPFWRYSTDELDKVSPDMALNHPVWQMGKRITIDSATLMNKGFEVIEAHYLFGMDYDRIKVVIHPKSIVHGMVFFKNGEVFINAYSPDMRIPLMNALLFPDIGINDTKKLSVWELNGLEFSPVEDHVNFKALKLCYEAGRLGGGYLVALNSADEVAVEAFLENKISFNNIIDIVEETLSMVKDGKKLDSYEDIVRLDQYYRDAAKEVVRKRCS